MKKILILLTALFAGATAFTFAATWDVKVCTQEYAPVCGQPPMPECAEGMACIQVMPAPATFGNKCEMEAAWATLLHVGTCEESQDVQLSNPASTFCSTFGGTVTIKTDDDGNQYGECAKNWTVCDEWAFYRGECHLLSTPLTPSRVSYLSAGVKNVINYWYKKDFLQTFSNYVANMIDKQKYALTVSLYTPDQAQLVYQKIASMELIHELLERHLILK